MGTSLEEQGIRLQRVEPAAYRVWFGGGGGSLDLLVDQAAMEAQLEAVEPGAAEGYRRVACVAWVSWRWCIWFFLPGLHHWLVLSLSSSSTHSCEHDVAACHSLCCLSCDKLRCRRFLKMARLHLNLGVPHFIDRDFEALANAKGLQVR